MLNLLKNDNLLKNLLKRQAKGGLPFCAIIQPLSLWAKQKPRYQADQREEQ
ncbi:MAG: hypothetical protein XD36_1341 [Halomonas sp. 54_146]|nr:MAG: hypothetical protein XD36_1341 [Halomonas sp. 54_146]